MPGCQILFQSNQRTLDSSQTYPKGTPKYGLSYSRNDDINGALIGYSDVDWGGDVNDRKSTSGYLFMMNGAAISWKSRKQTCNALSMAEFKYVALVGATQEATWIRHLLEDLHNGKTEPTIFREDNQSAICIEPPISRQDQNVDIKYDYV